jgi:hypothetical protein
MTQQPTCQQPAWVSFYAQTLRYVDGGRDNGLLDCFGFVRHVYQQQLGITLPAWPQLTLDQMAASDGSLLEARFNTGFEAVQMGFEQAFDVTVIRRPLAVSGKLQRGWWHLGVITRPAHVAHMDAGLGVVEVCFRDTAEELASATLGVKDVRLFRHHSLLTPAAQMEACA